MTKMKGLGAARNQGWLGVRVRGMGWWGLPPPGSVLELGVAEPWGVIVNVTPTRRRSAL